MPNNYKQKAKLAIKKIDGEISPGELQELFAWAAASPKRRRLLQQYMRDAALVRKAASFKTYDWKAAWNEMAALMPELEPVPIGEELAGTVDAPADTDAPDAAEVPGDPGAAEGDADVADEPAALPQTPVRPMKQLWLMSRRGWFAAGSFVFILAIGGLLWRFGTPWGKRVPQDRAAAGFAYDGVGRRISSPAGSAHSPPLAPGGDKALLTLSNDSTIQVESASFGTIASEGLVDIVKSAAGAIAYRIRGAPALAWEKGAFNVLSTPRGGQFLLELPEGSRVWLNADSRLRYPVFFSDSSRDVLLDGEAFFDIHAAYSAKGKKIPFVVHTSGHALESSRATSFIVTGTRFDVSAYADDPFLAATLVSGSIRVKEGRGTMLMHPGQHYTRDSSSGSGSLSTADTSADLAWTKGRFRFRNQPLHSIMRQVARWYDADVHFADSIPGRFTVAGSREEPVSSLLQKLSSINTVRFDIDGSTITISSR